MLNFLIKFMVFISNHFNKFVIVLYFVAGYIIVNSLYQPNLKHLETSNDYCTNIESNLVYNLQHMTNITKKLNDNHDNVQLLASHDYYKTMVLQIINRAYLNQCSRIINYIERIDK